MSSSVVLYMLTCVRRHLYGVAVILIQNNSDIVIIIHCNHNNSDIVIIILLIGTDEDVMKSIVDSVSQVIVTKLLYLTIAS